MSSKHLNLVGFDRNRKYSSKVQSRGRPLPQRDGKRHGEFLLNLVEKSYDKYNKLKSEVGLPPIGNSIEGIYLEVQGSVKDGLKFDSLDNTTFNLCNIKTDEENDLITATIFVPSIHKEKFLKKFQEYFDTGAKEKPKNYTLINTIVSIGIADIECFWTDEKNEFPNDKNKQFWWEIWLHNPKSKIISDEDISIFCTSIGAIYADQRINLKRTVIILVQATVLQLEKSIFLVSNLEEIKFVGDSPTFFLDQRETDNQEWIDDLQSRITVSPDYQSIKISILDTGINYNHPLLSKFITMQDCCSYGSNGIRWPLFTTYSAKGFHGSLQAGISLYGDLMPVLTSSNPITVNHSLESGRILPDYGNNDPQMYGYITQNICYQLEINKNVKRVFSMAVTADDSSGRPSSWSSAIDNLANEDNRRLFVISAGNAKNINPAVTNWENVFTNVVQDPAQAWNAITVGAYTDLYLVTDPNYKHWNLASNPGEITVSSTSSLLWTWKNNAPIKPEVVFEGGNYLISSCKTQLDACDDLGILTTAGDSKSFNIHRDTSAATAKASKFLAEVVAKYPSYWPETHRGILIHSAEWNTAMKQFVQQAGGHTKAKLSMLRTVGYGIPNIEVALNSDRNRVLLIVEREIEPFLLMSKNETQFNEMHLHTIPFPKNLFDLINEKPETNAKLKVTLSYFIEPNPSTKAISNKYSYRSAGFVFKVKSPLQTEKDFLASINKLDVYKEYRQPNSSNEGWAFNDDLRRLGSIHSDTWAGSVADLINMDKIAVLPVFGWWKNPKAEIDNFKTRYCLIISLEIENEIDIYTEIQNMISIQNEIKSEIYV